MKKKTGYDHHLESVIKRLESLRAHHNKSPLKTAEEIQKELDQLLVDLVEFRTACERIQEQIEEKAASFLMMQSTLWRYEELFKFAPDGYMVVDPWMKIIEVNQALMALLDVRQDLIIDKPLLEFVDGEYYKILRSNLLKLKKKENASLRFEIMVRSPGGDKTIRVEVVATANHNSIGSLSNYLLLIHDVSERRLAEQSSRELANQWQATFDATSDAICLLNKDLCIIRSNRAMHTMFQKSAQELFGTRYTTILFGEEETSPAASASQRESMEVYINGKYLDVSVNPVTDDGGILLAAILVLRDITERKQAEFRMEYLATHDELTNLPNRYLYRDRLKLAIERARRDQNGHSVEEGKVSIAVMLLDLDNFKFINDTFGHDEGDRVLKIVATRLIGSLRKTDTIARMGGDEFVLIHENVTKVKDVMQVAKKILKNLSEPISINHSFKHQLTGSIGISLYPMDGEDDVTLLKNADIAMYRAKEITNQIEFYDLPGG